MARRPSFNKVFWEDISHYLINSYNYSYLDIFHYFSNAALLNVFPKRIVNPLMSKIVAQYLYKIMTLYVCVSADHPYSQPEG